MCGIAGSVSLDLDITQLNRDLGHRGPDQKSAYQEQDVEFQHYRLAILDIAGGRQPMHFEHLSIIYNGEIYNHLEVREQLNLDCKTHSDTETILHAYAKLGVGCFKYFDGMFALAIYDRNKSELMLARDRAGKKPLYYYTKGKQFVFSSELNALRRQLPLQINDEHISLYLNAGYFFRSATPYRDVHELPAGTYATVSLPGGQVKIERWWDIHDYYLRRSKDDFQTALEKTDAMLHKAVKLRVESSDLEVGSFLSGGIDSGLVTAIAKSYNSSLKTFTVSFDGEYNEAPLAKLVADRYGTQHHEINIAFDHVLEDVEKILANYGEPFFDSSAIPSYYVSREAKKHLTVILNGDGGDEIFGGYRRYVPFAQYDFFQPGLFVKLASPVLYNIMPVSNNKRSKYNYVYRLVDFSRKRGIHAYLSSTLDVFEGMENNLIHGTAALQPVIEDFEQINESGLSGLQKMLNLDFNHILTSNLLVKMDIATMANSLEGRSPLMSKDLIEYVPTISDSYKIRGHQTKVLLRKLAEKYLPTELISQPKRGFEIPLKTWIDRELKDIIASYILSPNAYCRNFVEPTFIDKLWRRKIKMGDEKRAKIIWMLFALEVWYSKCYMLME